MYYPNSGTLPTLQWSPSPTSSKSSSVTSLSFSVQVAVMPAVDVMYQVTLKASRGKRGEYMQQDAGPQGFDHPNIARPVFPFALPTSHFPHAMCRRSYHCFTRLIQPARELLSSHTLVQRNQHCAGPVMLCKPQGCKLPCHSVCACCGESRACCLPCSKSIGWNKVTVCHGPDAGCVVSVLCLITSDEVGTICKLAAWREVTGFGAAQRSLGNSRWRRARTPRLCGLL